MQDNHYVGFHVMSAVEMVLRGSWDPVSTYNWAYSPTSNLSNSHKAT